MLWDTHLHTRFSGDSKANPEDIIQTAVSKNLAGICFTDHMDLDYREKPGLFDLDLPAYTQEIVQLQEKYAASLPILRGIEIGLQPAYVKENNGIISKGNFDFVIGSTHVVDHVDIYYPAYYEGKSEDDCYRRYFEEVLFNIKFDTDFDTLGHLDYVVRYGPNKNQFYSYEKFSDIVDEILRVLIVKGKGLELNTAGFKYGLGHAHPVPEILKRYRELGGEIITIGSDSHAAEQIAWDFEKVPKILKEAGFEYYTVFKNRKAEFFKL